MGFPHLALLTLQYYVSGSLHPLSIHGIFLFTCVIRCWSGGRIGTMNEGTVHGISPSIFADSAIYYVSGFGNLEQGCAVHI